MERNASEATPAEIAAVRHAVQAEITEEADGFAFVKAHAAVVMDHGRPTLNFDVTAGAVYVVRDPLGVAISLSKHIGESLDKAISIMADRESPSGQSEYEPVSSWSVHAASWTDKPTARFMSCAVRACRKIRSGHSAPWRAIC